MSCKTIEDLKHCVDDILKIRDTIGAGLKEVYLVTRTWSGDRVGDGKPKDESSRVLPTPRIVDFQHDIRLREGGAVKEGDIILKSISKNKYPKEDIVRCVSDKKNVEKFYMLGKEHYTVISLVENHLTWDVHIRRLSYQENHGRVK